MMPWARGALVLLLAAAVAFALCPAAVAAPPAAGTQTGHPVSAATNREGNEPGSPFCETAGPAAEGLIPWIGHLVGLSPSACEAAGKEVGKVAGAVGNSVLDGVATWIIGAATQVTMFVAGAMRQTTAPQLQSAWYAAQFAPMADLGAALGLLVALIALGSAAARRSPQMLAGALAGIVRAGIGTGLVIALTVVGLGVSDQISNAVLAGSPHAFWGSVALAWGHGGFGGFASSALAMLIALVELFAAVFVWLELIVRGAAIYVAVLFFPVVLAASIWPALSSWTGRLGRLLLLFVVLKPVALIVLSLAGNAAAAGLSFGEGIPSSVGTILAATVIFALAAFAPWALMYLLAADAESAYMAAGLRSAAGAAVADRHGRSLRNAGGLRDLAAGEDSATAGGDNPGGLPDFDGGDTPGGGPSSNGGRPGGGSPGGEDPGAAASGDLDGTLPVGDESVGAGSVGAAAGAIAQDTPTGEVASVEPAPPDVPASDVTGGGRPAGESIAFTNGSPPAQDPAGPRAAGGPPSGACTPAPGGSAGIPTEQPRPPASSPPPPPAADAPVGPGMAPAAAPPPRLSAVPDTPPPGAAPARATRRSAPEDEEE